MGRIEWLDISELPDELKDGRPLLVYGRAWGGYDAPSEDMSHRHWSEPQANVAPYGIHDLPYVMTFSGAVSGDPDQFLATHFAEINPPGEQDTGIPMFGMRTEK